MCIKERRFQQGRNPKLKHHHKKRLQGKVQTASFARWVLETIWQSLFPPSAARGSPSNLRMMNNRHTRRPNSNITVAPLAKNHATKNHMCKTTWVWKGLMGFWGVVPLDERWEGDSSLAGVTQWVRFVIDGNEPSLPPSAEHQCRGARLRGPCLVLWGSPGAPPEPTLVLRLLPNHCRNSPRKTGSFLTLVCLVATCSTFAPLKQSTAAKWQLHGSANTQDSQQGFQENPDCPKPALYSAAQRVMLRGWLLYCWVKANDSKSIL